jgi:hypothetical protein
LRRRPEASLKLMHFQSTWQKRFIGINVIVLNTTEILLKKVTKILFGSLHFGPISLAEILPDMDKQDSVSEMRSSASKLVAYIFN